VVAPAAFAAVSAGVVADVCSVAAGVAVSVAVVSVVDDELHAVSKPKRIAA